MFAMKKNCPKLEINPIVEAVFCVDLAGLPSLTPELAEKMKDSVADSYEKEMDQITQSLSFDLAAPDKTVSPKKFWQGMCFRNNTKRLLLSNLDQQIVRFSFSQLRPYDNWSSFISEARKLFSAFVGATHRDPVVKRLGVRFVNVLNIPEGERELGSMLQNVPRDPTDMSNISVEDFLYQETSYYKDYGLKATVIRTVQRPPNGNPFFVFDDDVFANPDIEVSQIEWPDLLDRMHGLKNDIFFGSVSEDCLKEVVAK